MRRANYLQRLSSRFLLFLLLLSSVAIPEAQAQSLAMLESPVSNAFYESGVSLIRGWACDAEQIEISIDDGQRLLAAYGTKRGDTQDVCGDDDNGFGLTINWSNIGDGVHNIKAYLDSQSQPFADNDFKVVTLGDPSYQTGLQGRFLLEDFPTQGTAHSVRWSEPHQNFVFVSDIAVSEVADISALPWARLESPSQGSAESGIGLIRGWVCEAERVEVSVDGGTSLMAAYGTKRADTREVCGDDDNGFGLTFNWSEIGDGTHNLRAYADSVEFANVDFAVTTLGYKYLTGIENQFSLNGFPYEGNKTQIRWSEPHQNFLIDQTDATEQKIASLAAVVDRQNQRTQIAGLGANARESYGVNAIKDDNGDATDITSITWIDDPESEQFADLELSEEGLPDVYTDSTGVTAQLDYDLNANTVTISFADSSGNSLGEPIEDTQIDTGILRSLQDVIKREEDATQRELMKIEETTGLRQLAVNDSAQASNETSIVRFSLTSLLSKLAWYSAAAASDTLCSIERASERAGLQLGIIATQGCQSEMLSAFVENTPRRGILVDNVNDDNLEEILARLLYFSEDILDAPCSDTDSNADCLRPATSELQDRANTPVPSAISEPDTDTIPAVPESVRASSGDADFIRVTWKASDGATSYQIYRSDTGEDIGLHIGTVAKLFFDDSSVAQDTIYYYRIKACNSAGCSGLSQSDNGYALKIPSTPLDVNASHGTYENQVIISWESVESAQYYEVFRSVLQETANSQIRLLSETELDCATAIRIDLVGETKFTDTNIVADQKYCYLVRACNSAGCSELSAPVSGYAEEVQQTFTVMTEAGSGGSIDPTSQIVNEGETASFTVTPDSDNHYVIDTVNGCNGSLSSNTYTTGAITANCTVSASFKLETYVVSATAGMGGSIDPTSQSVAAGQTASFTVTPDSANHYIIDTVTDNCGGGTLSDNTYTTEAIYVNCTVSASFKQTAYLVSTLAGSGGSISPTSHTVEAGQTASFTITPDSGHEIVSVSGCDGTLSDNTYTTGAINVACTVSASFDLETYVVSTSAGSGGRIEPTSRIVTTGQTTSFTVMPDSANHYVIDTVSGCGGSLSDNVYTTGVITANCTVSASFKLETYTVSATAGMGGSIDPTSQSVAVGQTTSFTVTPDSANHYIIDTVSGCNGNLSGNTYTTEAIYANCTVSASFKLETYVVSATAGMGGSIDPTSQSVAVGQTTSFTVTPDSANHYIIDTVSGCGGSLSDNVYTTGVITANCTVSASFKLETYVVSATAGMGGSISPVSQPVAAGQTTSFTVTPDSANHYIIDTVSGCNGNLSGNTYTTGAIHGNCTVSASFKLETYVVSATAGMGGSISPVSQPVVAGQTASFTVTPDSANHYIIDTVTDNCGGGTLSDNTYTTEAIYANCTVSATFKLETYMVSTEVWTNGDPDSSGGSISPTSATVKAGETTTFTITPNPGYFHEWVEDCNGSGSSNLSFYETAPIYQDCTVQFFFESINNR